MSHLKVPVTGSPFSKDKAESIDHLVDKERFDALVSRLQESNPQIVHIKNKTPVPSDSMTQNRNMRKYHLVCGDYNYDASSKKPTGFVIYTITIRFDIMKIVSMTQYGGNIIKTLDALCLTDLTGKKKVFFGDISVEFITKITTQVSSFDIPIKNHFELSLIDPFKQEDHKDGKNEISEQVLKRQKISDHFFLKLVNPQDENQKAFVKAEVNKLLAQIRKELDALLQPLGGRANLLQLVTSLQNIQMGAIAHPFDFLRDITAVYQKMQQLDEIIGHLEMIVEEWK